MGLLRQAENKYGDIAEYWNITIQSLQNKEVTVILYGYRSEADYRRGMMSSIETVINFKATAGIFDYKALAEAGTNPHEHTYGLIKTNFLEFKHAIDVKES